MSPSKTSSTRLTSGVFEEAGLMETVMAGRRKGGRERGRVEGGRRIGREEGRVEGGIEGGVHL